MKSAQLPLYEQTRLGILSIIQESLNPGDLLPTQEELSNQLDTSLITIKRALSELAREGVVESFRGKGTIVKGNAITDLHQGVSSWTDSLSGLGGQPETGWTTLTRTLPEPKIRNLLQMKARQPVVTIERLRLAGGKPVCLMTNCLPAHRVPGFESKGLSHESLYRCLEERYGLRFKEATESVRARQSSPEERAHLGENHTIILEIERLSLDQNGTALEWSQIIAPSDTYTYQIKLINP